MYQISLILPPALLLASIIINTLAFVAPVGLLRHFALVTIAPSTTDGPRLWMGVLGSCARSSYNASTHCTRALIFPKYDLSVLSTEDGIPFQVAKPSHAEAGLICASLVFSTLLCMSLVWRASNLWTENVKPSANRLENFAVILFGIGGAIGPCVFVFLRVEFNLAIKMFNSKAKQVENPKLVAAFGSSYILVWFGLVLFFISIFVLLVESHKANAAGGKKDETPV